MKHSIIRNEADWPIEERLFSAQVQQFAERPGLISRLALMALQFIICVLSAGLMCLGVILFAQ